MTDQSKIPLPPESTPADRQGSLIERAVKAFDLSNLAPPPLPDNLAPPVVKPAMRNRPASAPAPEAAPQPAPAPVAAAPAPALTPVEETPAAAPTPVVTPAAAPAPVAAATPAIVPQPTVNALQLAEEVVTFSGKRHPVDRAHLSELSLILPEGGVTALLEEFRIVKRQLLLQANELRRQGGGAAAQRIMVCSPHPGEGKTYCAVNLALSIAAEKESEVVLVDADFAKPSVLDALGLSQENGPAGKGLMDALVDPRVDVASLVMGTDIPGLWVLPAGHATTTDSEYLNASHTREVLDRLTQGAPRRIVLFDTPPVLAASPAAELARYVGQTVMVVRADRTTHGAIEDAVQLLSGCPNIQLLLNDVHFSPSGRRFGAYYGYGG